MPLLLLLAGFVAVEIVLIITVGSAIGAGWTLLLLVAGSLLGGYLLRREGSRALAAFRTAVTTRRPPHNEIADGVLVVFGGVLMVLPGFLSDLLGLLCLVPPTRAVLRRWLFSLLLRKAGPVGMLNVPSTRMRRAGPGVGKGGVIEGEIVEPPPGAPPA